MRYLSITYCTVFLCFFFLSACAEHVAPAMERPQGSLAIAGFTHPTQTWQFLAGYVDPAENEITAKDIQLLDKALVDILTGHRVVGYMQPVQTRRCQEIVAAHCEGERSSALEYWLQVGRCAQVDWLLVPQVLAWKERKGEEWGIAEPASVVLDFYYIDVQAGEIAVRKHFEEVQLALSDDLRNAGKYFQRGGTWVTALRLAQEGMEYKLREMGL